MSLLLTTQKSRSLRSGEKNQRSGYRVSRCNFSWMASTIQAVRLTVRRSIASTSSFGSLRCTSSRDSYCFFGPRRFCSAITFFLSRQWRSPRLLTEGFGLILYFHFEDGFLALLAGDVPVSGLVGPDRGTPGLQPSRDAVGAVEPDLWGLVSYHLLRPLLVRRVEKRGCAVTGAGGSWHFVPPLWLNILFLRVSQLLTACLYINGYPFNCQALLGGIFAISEKFIGGGL